MPTKTKEQRGLALIRDHARQIVEVDWGVYWVPSCSGGGYADTLPERPRVRRGGLRDNRPAPGRGSAPSAGAAVASGGWGYLDPRAIAAGFDRMGV